MPPVQLPRAVVAAVYSLLNFSTPISLATVSTTVTVSGLNVNFGTGGTYWLNLQNASRWRRLLPLVKHSGVGCGGDNGMGSGCPSLAQDSGAGSIPSESFTVLGAQSSTTSTSTTTSVPEPSSIMLFGSGILGVVGLLRRRLF